jgi:hypothetical protein
MINLTLRHDLNLTKKSARWVPKLPTDDMEKERVRMSQNFLAMVFICSVSQPGPVKATGHTTRTKQMVLAFLRSKDLIYTNYVPRGTTVNANYIMEALCMFMKILKKKRSETGFSMGDNALVHTVATVTD